jgi:hypothetical protein
MSRPFITTIMVFAAWTLVSIPSWGKTASNDLRTTINLDSTTRIANKKLKAGKYKVIAEGKDAKFEQGGKIVAQVPCSMKMLPDKAKQDEFELDHGRLTEIEVSGKTQAIQFGS